MESQLVRQRDFGAGQIDEEAARRDDLPFARSGLRRARNMRILSSNALRRRPGRRVLFTAAGKTIRVDVTGSSVQWEVTFSLGKIEIRQRGATAVAFTSTGEPWTTTARLADMKWQMAGAQLIVTHQEFAPRVFIFAGGAWSVQDFAFATDPDGSTREPFFAFQQGTGITMTPSARSGSVTITFSGPVLTSAHVGVRFRYAGEQLIMTAVSSATQGTATVVSGLPPTFDVTLSNADGLQLQDSVVGDTTGTEGRVVAILPGPIARVIVTKNWSGFQAGSPGEVFIGPRTRATVTAISAVSPGPSLDWDEALMSGVRGWPGTVGYDNQRVIFADLPAQGSAVAWSAVGTFNDFQPGTEASDAILEFVARNCRVTDVIGGADEFVFTDRGIFYVPISETNPLRPGGVVFRNISADASSRVRPVESAEGVLYINAARTRVLSVVGTGQTARPYIVDDVSEFHSNLFNMPIAIATSSADAAAPERYVYVVNSDGTMAVGRYQRDRNFMGWVPWDGAGVVEWVADGGDEVLVTARYETGGNTVRFAEVFDDTLLTDATLAVLSPDTGGGLVIGDIILGLNWPAGSVISIMKGDWYRGDYPVQPDGTLGDAVFDLQNVVGLSGGFNFTTETTPFVPHVQEGTDRGQTGRRRRVKRMLVHVLRSQALQIGKRLWPFWRAGENQEQAPPERTETYRARQLGRSFDPQWSIVQEVPGKLTLLEIGQEVTI